MNTNYFKIFIDKKEKQPLLKKMLTDIFGKIKLSKKHKILGIISIICMGVSFVMKLNAAGGSSEKPLEGVKSMYDILTEMGADPLTAAMIVENWDGVQIIKNMLNYLTGIQIKSIDYINATPFGTSTMFEHIYSGLTIFAVIGCVYKLVLHFLKTERFDNVSAFTGFFQFIGIAVLFVFSDQIVNQVVSLNQGVSTESIQTLNIKLDNELTAQITKDLKPTVEEIKEEYENIALAQVKKKDANPISSLAIDIEIMEHSLKIAKLIMWDAGMALQWKYIYFSIVVGVIASILAIPSVIISIMIKILLTVMVAGTKLVFLLAFIPGFENTWKTFMTNMLNILLWAPIFNAIYSFIISLVSFMLGPDPLGTGQIIWLTIVTCILAFQSISLTTSAAGVVIQGAGASMAGALGSMATMSGVNVAMGVTKAAVGVGAAAAGGAVAGGAMASKSMSKK
jgi:membrane protein